LVPEILAHFFCPSGKFFLEKMKDLRYVRISTILPLYHATKWRLGVLSPAGGLLGRGLASVI
jgi:hypothetical protein